MNEYNEKQGQKNKDLTLVIKTTQGSWETVFSKTAKIQSVIDAIIAHFGFAQGGNYELMKELTPEESLKPERTLVSYHITDGEILIFTDLGVAV